jgi:hypothetical protein
MKRRILIGVLAIGTVLGFGSGFASLHYRCHQRDQMVEHLSRVCVDSAMDAAGRDGAPDADAIGDETAFRHHGWRGRRLARVEREVRDVCTREGRRHGRL